jgi:hypothetical protein
VALLSPCPYPPMSFDAAVMSVLVDLEICGYDVGSEPLFHVKRGSSLRSPGVNVLWILSQLRTLAPANRTRSFCKESSTQAGEGDLAPSNRYRATPGARCRTTHPVDSRSTWRGPHEVAGFKDSLFGMDLSDSDSDSDSEQCEAAVSLDGDFVGVDSEIGWACFT